MKLFIACCISAFTASFSTAPSLTVTSPAFSNNGKIPMMYTCEGKGTHPAVSVKNVPDNAKTLALILNDPDANAAGFVHWVTFNIPVGAMIEEGSGTPGTEGNNGRNQKGYTGPCPPAGTGVHHYHFMVYALDSKLDLAEGANKMQLMEAMKGHIVAQGELVGLYQKGGQ
jgi:Raf kinase inhibitor-like YbhB/YbcL family protein